MLVLALAEMIEPLEWQHVIISCLPEDELTILQTPTPFIIGVRSHDREVTNDVVIFDLDTTSIKTTSVATTQEDIDSFPNTLFDKLHESITATNNMNWQERNEMVKSLMREFIDTIVGGVGKYVRLHEESEHGTEGSFNESSFISHCDPSVYSFIRRFRKTSLFRNYADRVVQDYVQHPVASKLRKSVIEW